MRFNAALFLSKLKGARQKSEKEIARLASEADPTTATSKQRFDYQTLAPEHAAQIRVLDTLIEATEYAIEYEED